jgi:hypothetical protein
MSGTPNRRMQTTAQATSLAAAAIGGAPRRVVREDIRQLLSKKRETFLVQVG